LADRMRWKRELDKKFFANILLKYLLPIYSTILFLVE
jgi:hypothetical protein